MFSNYGIASARIAMKTQRKDGNIVPRVARYLRGGMPVRLPFLSFIVVLLVVLILW